MAVLASSGGLPEVSRTCFTADELMGAGALQPGLADHEICRQAFMAFVDGEDDQLPLPALATPDLPQPPAWLSVGAPGSHATCHNKLQLFDLNSIAPLEEGVQDVDWDDVLDVLHSPTASQAVDPLASPVNSAHTLLTTPKAQRLSPGIHRFSPSAGTLKTSSNAASTATGITWGAPRGLEDCTDTLDLFNTTQRHAGSRRCSSDNISVSESLGSKSSMAVDSTTLGLAPDMQPLCATTSTATALSAGLGNAQLLAQDTPHVLQARVSSSGGGVSDCVLPAKVVPGPEDTSLLAQSLLDHLARCLLPATDPANASVSWVTPANDIDANLLPQLSEGQQQVMASDRKATQVAQRKRWGAGQLHPQQAQIDAMLMARQSSLAAPVVGGASVVRQASVPAPSSDGPAAGKADTTSAGKGTTARGTNGKRVGSTYLTQGCALTAVVAAATVARANSKISRAGNDAGDDSKLKRKRSKSASPSSETATDASSAASVGTTVNKAAPAAAAPPNKKQCTTLPQSPASDASTDDTAAAVPESSQAVASTEPCNAEVGKPKPKLPKPVPVTNRPPQTCGIVAGILAEARNLKSRGPISFTPQSRLDVPVPAAGKPASGRKTAAAKHSSSAAPATAPTSTKSDVPDSSSLDVHASAASKFQQSPFQRYQPDMPSMRAPPVSFTTLMSEPSCDPLDTYLSSGSVTHWSVALESAASVEGSVVQAATEVSSLMMDCLAGDLDRDDDTAVFQGLINAYGNNLDDDMWDVVTAVCALDQ